jgi:hypothetical protein
MGKDQSHDRPRAVTNRRLQPSFHDNGEARHHLASHNLTCDESPGAVASPGHRADF